LRPTRIRESKMEKYDISKLTRDQLLIFLSNTKDSMVEYTRCCERVENCKRSIEENAKKSNTNVGGWIAALCVVVVLGIFIAIGIMRGETIIEGSSPNAPVLGPLIPFGIIGFILFIMVNVNVNIRKEARNNLQKYKAQLPDLQKKEDKSFDKFLTVIEPYDKFPGKYWYEYAPTKMFEFVDDKLAENWKEVVALYEEHLHRKKMEDNARQTLEEMKNQSNDIRDAKNAARFAAITGLAAALRR